MSSDIEEKHLKTLAKGAGIIFLGMVLAKGLAYVFRIAIGRMYGPTEFGLFSIGLAVFTIFSVIAMLGLNNTIIHYIAQFRSRDEKERVKGVILFSFKLVLPVSVILTLILFMLSDFIAEAVFHDIRLSPVLEIFSIALPFYSLVLIGSVVFVGFKRVKYQVYSDHIASNVFKLVFLAAFMLMGLGMAGIIYAWLAGTAIAGFLSVYYICKIFPGIRTVKAEYQNRQMLHYALPLYMSNIMIIVFSYIDIIVLGYFPSITVADIGVYSASVTVAQLLTVITTALTAVFLPVLTQMHSSGQRDAFRNIYKAVTRWAFFAIFPAFLMMIFFSRKIIDIFFGADFISGGFSLILLSAGYLLFSMSIIPFLLLNSIKKTKLVFYVTAITLVLSLILSFMLIPVFGIDGAAGAVLAVNILRIMLLVGVSYHFVKAMPFDKSIAKSLISGSIALIFVNSLSRTLFTEFPLHIVIMLFTVFITIYLGILLITKGFGREDIELLKYLEKRSGIRLGIIRKVLKRFV